jgi:hypothetical protein
MTPSQGRLLLLVTCWCALLLRAGWAVAGAGSNDVPLNGIPLNGASQQDGAPAAGPSARAAHRVATPSTPPPAAGDPIPIALADPDLASTAAKREQLKYLVRCALPAEVALYADIEGERFTFPGSIGLAPRWLTEAMTPSEERWVSACLLAHVNYFGKHVRISIRATGAAVPELEASADEQQTYTIFEGGFFGNLFAPAPVAYTCRGERTPTQAADPILQDRVCTQETGETTAEGTPLTVCQFLVTGRCEEPTSFTVDGLYYPEVVFVYLKPSTR